MNTEIYYKKVLKINKLVPFKQLSIKSQELLEQLGFEHEYQELIPDFPEFFAVQHTQEVADYLNRVNSGGNYSEDLER